MRQIAELQKGMIFHTPLDEWSGGRDLVSGTIPTNTAVYPVLDNKGNGRRALDCNGVNSKSIISSLPPFGVNDFSIIINFNVSDKTALSYQGLFGQTTGSDGIGLWIYNKQLTFELGTPTTYINLYFPNASSAIISGVNHSLSIIVTRSSYVDCYLDGILRDHVLISLSTSVNITATDYNIGRFWAGYFKGSIYMFRVFNYALTSQQVINYSKPEYPIEWIDRIIGTTGANLVVNGDFATDTIWSKGVGWTISGGTANTTAGNTLQQAGLMTIDKRYINKFDCINYVSGTVGVNTSLGYTQHTGNGTFIDLFIAVGTSLSYAVWSGVSNLSIDNASLIQAGCVLNLNAEGLTSATWVDKTNSLTATNSATTFILSPESNLGAMYFNGAARLIYNPIDNLSGDLTIAFKFRMHSNGVIFDNGSLYIYFSGILSVTRDNNITSAIGGNLNYNTTYTVLITSTSLGITNIYINNILYGNINQSAGTPISGTKNWYIGSRYSLSYTISGLLSKFTIWNRILLPDEIQLINQIL